MKKIGLIGGMSWESTQSYYSIINTRIKEELGGLHSAEILLYSVDFHQVEYNQSHNLWDDNVMILVDAAKRLETAGADFILICTNTMHKIYEDVQSQVSIPIIHIADATAEAIKKKHLQNVLLLGTKYTMLEDFYTKRLEEHNLNITIPNPDDINTINDIIFQELCVGEFKDTSKQTFIDMIKNSGCEGVLLGCTEIGLLISQDDLDIAVFDTTEIHANSAVLMAIE